MFEEYYKKYGEQIDISVKWIKVVLKNNTRMLVRISDIKLIFERPDGSVEIECFGKTYMLKTKFEDLYSVIKD